MRIRTPVDVPGLGEATIGGTIRVRLPDKRVVTAEVVSVGVDPTGGYVELRLPDDPWILQWVRPTIFGLSVDTDE